MRFEDDGASFRLRRQRALERYFASEFDPRTRRLLCWAFLFVAPFLALFVAALIFMIAAFLWGGAADAAEAYASGYESRGKLGAWSLRFYTDVDRAFVRMSRCVAVQMANGAEIEATLDPDNPQDRRSVRILAQFSGRFNATSIWVDDKIEGTSFNTYEPDRHGMSGVVPLSALAGDQLFVTFQAGPYVVGRYEFSIGDIDRLSDFLHGDGCAFPVSAPPKAARSRP